MVKINWTDQAITDLINISEYIAKDRRKYAKITIKNILETTRHLKKFSEAED
jgi:toxin ParE1/3/4